MALHIQKNPNHFERPFIEKVYNMADKLKYFDPVLEKSLDEINEEDGSMQSGGQLQWQRDLFNLLNNVSGFHRFQLLNPYNYFEIFFLLVSSCSCRNYSFNHFG